LAVVNVTQDAELFDYRSQCAGMVDVIVGDNDQIQGIVQVWPLIEDRVKVAG
jgi:hypothetical protein